MNGYHLGCPIWGLKEWVGKYVPSGTKPADYLRQYARVLTTVEGNTTFYGIPRAETVLKWRDSVPETFRFCFKFPREITHTNHLHHVRETTTQFLRALKPLEDQLGVLFIQLPPTFSKSGLPALQDFLRILPKSLRFAVEPRHPDFFDEGENEDRFNDLLLEFRCERVNFLTSTLHGSTSQNEHVLAAQKKKPRLPDRSAALGPHPFLRYVGHLDVESNRDPLTRIADHVAGWIDGGKAPFIFLHSPGEDLTAPEICRLFHGLLRERVQSLDVGPFPDWPLEESLPLFEM